MEFKQIVKPEYQFEVSGDDVIEWIRPNQIDLKKKERDDKIANALSGVDVETALEPFLGSLKQNTEKTYRVGFTYLFKNKILDPKQKLDDFAILNYNDVLHAIQNEHTGSKASRMNRAAAFISFTKFLNKKTNGLVAVCTPHTTGVDKTFFKVREKATSKPLSRPDCVRLLDSMKVVHYTTYIIAKIALNSGRRILEVLNLKWRDINFNQNTISFRVLKTRTEKIVRVKYGQDVFDDLSLLKRSLKNTLQDCFVFSRPNGTRISYPAVWSRFKKVSQMMGQTITPHNLRATYISLASSEGFRHSEIAAITGHSSVAMVNYYDGLSEPGKLSELFSVVN